MIRIINAGLFVFFIAVQAQATDVQEAQHSPLFDQMLAYVYLHNPQLEAERKSVAIADEKVSQATSGFRPTLSANGAAGRQRESVDGGDWVYGPGTNIGATATQPVFNGFGTLAQRRAADQRVLAARAHMRAVEQNILLLAATGWMEMCEKEKILALTKDNLRHMEEYNSATLQRFKAGDGTQTDVAQAESRLAQAEARLASAQADRDSARAAFERSAGLQALTVEFPSLPQELPKDVEEAIQMAKSSPDLAQASYQEKAAEQDIEAAKSSLWPSVYVQATSGEDNSPVLGLQRQRDDTITINMSIPLYQGGAEYSRIREAEVEREKSRFDTIDIEREVRERAQFSWNNYRAAQTVIDASTRASDAASRALSGVEEEQKQGLRTLTEVLDEELQVLNSEVSEVQAEKNVRLEAYRLLASMGKFTAQDLHLPVDYYDPQKHYDDTTKRWVGF